MHCLYFAWQEIEVTEDDIQQWGMEERLEAEDHREDENASPAPETPGSPLGIESGILEIPVLSVHVHAILSLLF